MIDVELGDLPGRMAKSINRERFLFAYSLPERGRYIARHVRADGRKEELEFDVALGRTLTDEERRRELPEGGREALADEGVTISPAPSSTSRLPSCACSSTCTTPPARRS